MVMPVTAEKLEELASRLDRTRIIGFLHEEEDIVITAVREAAARKRSVDMDLTKYVLVEREPTAKQIAAFDRLCDDNGACLVRSGYRAMVEASDAPRIEDVIARAEARIHYAVLQGALARFLPNRSSSLPVDRHSPSAAPSVEGAFSEDER